MKNFLYKEIKIFSCIIIVYVLMLVSCNSATALTLEGGQNGLEANAEFHGCDTTPACLNGNWPQQGPTNWCLATCMNIVYRDYLVRRRHIVPNQVLGLTPDTTLFAELAFVLAPGELNINFEILQHNPDVQAYLQNRFGAIMILDPASQTNVISKHFKGLSKEERNNIWNGGNPQPNTLAQQFNFLDISNLQAGLTAMPQGIKNSINTTMESVEMIFQMLTQNQNFVQHHEIVNYPEENLWRAIFDDIWNNERIVIVNMVYANGDRHSLVAYGARKTHIDVNNVVDQIMIYDPSDGYSSDFVNVNSRDTVRLHAGNAKIDGFIVFNY